MRVLFASALALCLPACGQADGQTTSDPAAVAKLDGSSSDGAIPITEDDASSEPKTAAEHDMANGAEGGTPAGQIPARFHGVWDHVAGTCSPESDMRMEISARQITFYESVGMVAGVGAEGNQPLVDLMMEGEGEKWFESRRLTLMKDGTELHVSDAMKPKVVDEYPRKRCPQ